MIVLVVQQLILFLLVLYTGIIMIGCIIISSSTSIYMIVGCIIIVMIMKLVVGSLLRYLQLVVRIITPGKSPSFSHHLPEHSLLEGTLALGSEHSALLNLQFSVIVVCRFLSPVRPSSLPLVNHL